MLRFAELKNESCRSGKVLEDPDLLIAATALYHDIPLVTHNYSHYIRITNQSIEDWCQ